MTLNSMLSLLFVCSSRAQLWSSVFIYFTLKMLKNTGAEAQHLGTGSMSWVWLFILRILHLKLAPSFGQLPIRHRLLLCLTSVLIKAAAVSESRSDWNSQPRPSLLLLQVVTVLTWRALRWTSARICHSRGGFLPDWSHSNRIPWSATAY